MPMTQLQYFQIQNQLENSFSYILANFKEMSALKANSSKTEEMWLGSLKICNTKPLGIKWPQDPFKAVGVFFTYD